MRKTYHWKYTEQIGTLKYLSKVDLGEVDCNSNHLPLLQQDNILLRNWIEVYFVIHHKHIV